MLFVNQLLTLLEVQLRIMIKYRFRGIVWAFMISPIIWALDILLRGTYVASTEFYSMLVPYGYLLFLGVAVVDFFTQTGGQIFYEIIENPRVFIMSNKASWILSKVLYNLIEMFIYVLIAWTPLHVFYKLSINFLLFSMIMMLIFIPFTISVILLLSYFIFRLREDAQPLWWSLNFASWSIFPVGFALTIFPEPLRTYLEILFPPFGLIEEIRKLAILGEFDINILVLSLVTSVIYLIIGSIVFYYGYTSARRKGIILLK